MLLLCYYCTKIANTGDLQETRRKDEEAEANSDLQIAQETATAKLARDINNEVLTLPELPLQ